MMVKPDVSARNCVLSSSSLSSPLLILWLIQRRGVLDGVHNRRVSEQVRSHSISFTFAFIDSVTEAKSWTTTTSTLAVSFESCERCGSRIIAFHFGSFMLLTKSFAPGMHFSVSRPGSGLQIRRPMIALTAPSGGIAPLRPSLYDTSALGVHGGQPTLVKLVKHTDLP